MQRIALGILFSFFWSSAFIAGKYSIKYLAPLNFISLRLGLAGVALLLASFAYRYLTKHSLNLNAFKNPYLWRDAFVLGLCNYVFYLGLSYTGMQYVSPELAVLLVSTTPFVTSFVVSWIAKTWSKLLWLAITMGFLGVFLVLSARIGGVSLWIKQLSHPTHANELITGVTWLLLAVVAVSIGTLYFQFFAKKTTDKLYLVALQNMVGAIILFPFVDLAHWSAVIFIPEFLISLIYQMIFVSMIAMIMWFKVIEWFGPGYASAFHLLNPIFATFLSVILFGVQLTTADIIGTLMVVFAMGIVSLDLVRK
ncbi:DMT family transporter [Psychrobacter sp. HD31]|uniref:DMT family transporter n=1 Tax=Psychrobacter sp. HD31 TaxID=3112003 RepID=UPI003DA60CD9